MLRTLFLTTTILSSSVTFSLADAIDTFIGHSFKETNALISSVSTVTLNQNGTITDNPITNPTGVRSGTWRRNGQNGICITYKAEQCFQLRQAGLGNWELLGQSGTVILFWENPTAPIISQQQPAPPPVISQQYVPPQQSQRPEPQYGNPEVISWLWFFVKAFFYLMIATALMFAFGFIRWLLPSKPKVPRAPLLNVPPLPVLEPLKPGALMRATIEPLPNNIVRLIIQLSDEAREILTRQNIWSRTFIEEANPIYETQMEAYKRAWQDYEDDKKSKAEVVRWFAKRPIDLEPSKVIHVTVAEFCNPQGFVRAFASAGEAKSWAAELRTHIEKLRNILESNRTPAQKETFDF